MDIDALLAPVSPESPCGENLEYDPDYAAMEQAAAGKPEQQFGSTVIPGEEPDWRVVRGHALELFKRTRDLRVAQYLTRGLVHTDGLPGLADGLALLVGLVEQHWDAVHPQLDPDDDNDPTLRTNTVASLCDAGAMLRAIREAPLVRSRAMGTFSYRDILVANGELPPPGDGQKPDSSAIDGAFADCDADELKAAATAVNQALERATALEDAVTRQVGVSRAPSLDDLTSLLKAMARLMHNRLDARGLLEPQPIAADSNGSADGAESDGHPAAAAANGRNTGAAVGLAGDITSREDVIRAIDKICEYYRRYEPSSPVPLFLNRAKRLASKSFLEILRDLTPDALSQALAIGGIGDSAAGGGNDEDL